MDKIKLFIWQYIPLKVLVLFRNKIFKNPIGWHKKVRLFFLPRRYQCGHDLFDFDMTPELALFIRNLRVVHKPHGYTWRAVSREVYDNFPELRDGNGKSGIIRGDQMDGKWLCDYAMRFYNETWEDGWN